MPISHCTWLHIIACERTIKVTAQSCSQTQ